MSLIKIVNVVANDDYTLLLELSNHDQVVYDMKPRLGSVRFCHLIDLQDFRAVSVDYGHTLVWSGLCQLTIEEIMAHSVSNRHE